MNEPKKVFTQAGLAYAFMIFVIYIGQILLGSVLYQLPADSFWLTQDGGTLLSSVLLYGLATPVGILLLRAIPVCENRPSQKMGGKNFAMGFLICISAMYVGNYLGQLLMTTVDQLRGVQTENYVADSILEMHLPVTIVLVVILAPIVEEFLFRKCLLDRIRCYGDAPAILVSGITFGIMHGNFFQFFYAFALGCIFAYVYLKTGRIRYPILYHMGINFLGSVAATAVMKHVDMDLLMEMTQGVIPDLEQLAKALPGIAVMVMYSLVLLGCAILGMVFFFIKKKQLVLESGERPLEKTQRWRVVFLNAGMVLYLLCGAVMFLMNL